MSKLSALGQSMASLFSPENDKMRRSQKIAAKDSAPSLRSTAPIMSLKEGSKSQDSLGNPASPGYSPLNPEENEAKNTSQEIPLQEQGAIPLPGSKGRKTIRLNAGWEKVLVAQKKLCDKARNLFTTRDAPERYSDSKKNKSIGLKSRGCILDLDVEKHRQEQEHLAKLKKSDDEAA